jgi:hypothetical protein
VNTDPDQLTPMMSVLIDRAIRSVHGQTADMVTREEGMRSVCEALERAS